MTATTRRAFVKNAALAAFGIGAAPAWLTRAAFAGTPGKHVLVAIFQRGAMDGLNAVIPFGEKRYAELRPALAVPRESIVELDGFFGLHPALKPLYPMWEAKQLAAIHATGSPDPTRSHFDAQDFMESGTPGRKATRDGWLNRAIGPRKATSPIRAVSMGGTLARSLRGPNAAVAMNTIGSFQVRDNAQSEFMSMYSQSTDTVLKGTGKETFEAVKLLESISKSKPASTVNYPNSRLGTSLQQIAMLIKADAGLEVAFADTTGWDTHVGQAPALERLLGDFAQSLAAFHQDLGARMAGVTVVSMSEFGRTAKENGNRGTDHGHANVMFALGGDVQGGKVLGNWPGLEPEQLYERRDLAVTTDFRDVLSGVVQHHSGTQDMAKIFPGYEAKPLHFFRPMQ
ncbi:MAG: DUF1501 domain-containing protein [Acidobacteria bacterium]|nr:DUF1501 domain-containing protein [Acidobacteriota bacterium]